MFESPDSADTCKSRQSGTAAVGWLIAAVGGFAANGAVFHFFTVKYDGWYGGPSCLASSAYLFLGIPAVLRAAAAAVTRKGGQRGPAAPFYLLAAQAGLTFFEVTDVRAAAALVVLVVANTALAAWKSAGRTKDSIQETAA